MAHIAVNNYMFRPLYRPSSGCTVSCYKVKRTMCNASIAVDETLFTVYKFPPPQNVFNPLKPELNPICYLLALLGAQHFLHVSRIRVKLLTLRLLMSYIYIYIYGAPILDVSRSHTTTQHSR